MSRSPLSSSSKKQRGDEKSDPDPRRLGKTTHDVPIRADPWEKIKTSLEKEWRSKKNELAPKFAQNLGDMAKALNSEKPLRGLKKMFREAFGDGGQFESSWAKRRRYVRLPNEKEGDPTQYGQCAKTWPPYVDLARAYASIRYPRDEAKKIDAIWQLFKHTELDPLGGSNLRELNGLDEALEQLKKIQSRCLSDVDIDEAFDYLNRFPVAPFLCDEIEGGLSKGNLGSRVRGAGLSIISSQQPTIRFCANANDGADPFNPDGYWWAPRVHLGWIYFPKLVSDVSLEVSPSELNDTLLAAIKENPKKPPKEVVDEEICALIERRLQAKEITEFWPGDEKDGQAIIPDSIRKIIYERMEVYLMLHHDGKMARLTLSVRRQSMRRQGGDKRNDLEYLVPLGWELHPIIVYEIGATPNVDKTIWNITDEKTDEISSDLNETDNWSFCDGVPFLFIEIDRNKTEYPLELGQLFELPEKVVHVIGMDLGQLSCPDYSESLFATRSVDEETVLELMSLGSGIEKGEASPFKSVSCRLALAGVRDQHEIFKPAVWDDPSYLSPAPHNSIAATILRNLAYAPADQRIDSLLIRDAHKRLKDIVPFVQEELARTLSRLSEL